MGTFLPLRALADARTTIGPAAGGAASHHSAKFAG
jgi:hypothetical protein